MSIKMRQLVEKKIVRRMVSDLLKAGFALNVDNGGDDMELPKPSTDKKLVLATLFATDDERLFVYKPVECGGYVGWVWFVYGNDGNDVINDYSVNMESHMAGVKKLADFYGG